MSDFTHAALVTGGGRGIGRAIALRMARETAVVVVGRTEGDLQTVCREIRQSGGHALACAGDAAHAGTAERAVQIARESGWTIRHLICNAGIGKSGPTATFDQQLWQHILEVNLGGAFHFIQACLPTMLEARQGTICIISSISGLKGAAHSAAYAASKHALVGLARTLALEYGKHGIVTVPICPGFVDTEMTRRTIRGVMKRRAISQEEAEKLICKVSPQRRIIPPEEVAEMAAFVCSGKVPSLNGNPLILTGGE